MIDLGDELADFEAEPPRPPAEPGPSGDLIKGGHVPLADLQASGFNVKPDDYVDPRDYVDSSWQHRILAGLAGARAVSLQLYHLPDADAAIGGFKPIGRLGDDDDLSIDCQTWLPGDSDTANYSCGDGTFTVEVQSDDDD